MNNLTNSINNNKILQYAKTKFKIQIKPWNLFCMEGFYYMELL